MTIPYIYEFKYIVAKDSVEAVEKALEAGNGQMICRDDDGIEVEEMV